MIDNEKCRAALQNLAGDLSERAEWLRHVEALNRARPQRCNESRITNHVGFSG
jgi:hypothetical protein